MNLFVLSINTSEKLIFYPSLFTIVKNTIFFMDRGEIEETEGIFKD